MQRDSRHSITYGATEIAYEVVFSHRRTLAMEVAPDGCVSVRAPQGSSLGMIAEVVRKRAGWIVTQQQRFQSYAPPAMQPREYVSGESYRYLGRQYRLKVRDGTPEQVALGRTDMFVTARDKKPERVGRVLEAWYRAESRRIFTERVAPCWPHVAH